MNPYVGHESQLYGVEEHRLVGGKADGMRIYEIHNGNGLELTVSPDRNNDITRLRYKGVNLSYMTACGNVAPAYYDKNNFLQSFTAGFLTTCGLQSIGTPCVDGGEELPMHGSIGNTPCEQSWWTEEKDALMIHSLTKDEVIFGRKLRLARTIKVSLTSNEFEIEDVIKNTGDRVEPIQLLYHMNMGYPMLDEESIVKIASDSVIPRDEDAAKGIETWMKMEKPSPQYQEQCFYHKFDKAQGKASIFQPKKQVGLEITFDTSELDCFVEWKMMGVRDYVLGLECGNSYVDGRDVMREKGILKFLAPGEKKTYHVHVRMLDAEE